MKKVSFSDKKVAIGNKTYSAEDALFELVMNRPGWRRLGNVKVALSISDKLDKPGPKFFTNMEHDALLKEAELQDSGGIAPREMNRFYLSVLQSLYDAEDVVDDPERKAAE